MPKPRRLVRFAGVASLAAAAFFAVAAPAKAQDGAAGTQEASEADRAGAVISLIELADTEYADAVADGEVVNAAEYEEAAEFTAEALRRLEALGEPADAEAAAAARRAAVRMPGAIERLVEPAEFAELAEEAGASIATGWNAVRIRFAEHRPSAERGARVYRAHCAACHGAAGRGDGPAAEAMEPPPADLAAPIRSAEATLRRDFEVTSFGIPATTMAGWGERLSLQERWDVAAYIQGFRFAAADVAEGRSLALGGETPVAGLVRAWTDPEQVLGWTDEEMAALVSDAAPRHEGAEARAIVAYLRAQAAQPLAGVPELDVAAQAAGKFARIDSLITAAVSAARSGDSETARREAIAAYMTFEALEPAIGARNPDALAEVEARFADLRADIAMAGTAPDRGPLDEALAAAAAALTQGVSTSGLAVQSFVIILREGFEAILIIGAIMAFLVKTGREKERGAVRGGVVAAIVASLGVGVLLEAVFVAAPARREVLEGATMLLAVAVLFSVSFWLVSKLQHGRWEAYLKDKMTTAVGAGGGLALASVAFLAVFREGVETVLFYKALGTMSAGGDVPIALGFVAGLFALGAIYAGYTKLGVRIPMRPFFALTSGVLYAMAIVFAGAGIAELQEAGVVGLTPVVGVPAVPALGLYPTLETLAAQGVLVALLIGALFVTFGLPRLTRSEEVAGAAG